MTDPSNICLSCGICCNGTLIGYVMLDKSEISRIKKIMDIEEENEHGFFLQPCKKFCNGCTVYDNRPRQCASFNCKLLESVEQKKLGFSNAVEIIDLINQKKISLEDKLTSLHFELQSPSFYFKMVELNNILEENNSITPLIPSHLELQSDLNQLNSLLLNNMGVSFY